AHLDLLCLTGEVAWARLSSGPTQVVGATPIALVLRENVDVCQAFREDVKGNHEGTKNTKNTNLLAQLQPRRHEGTKNTSSLSQIPPRRHEDTKDTSSLSQIPPPRHEDTKNTHSEVNDERSEAAARVLEHLRSRGASFATEIGASCELNGDALRAALGE